MCYQVYYLHLIDGTMIEVPEKYEVPLEKGVVGKFRAAAEEDLFEVGNAINGFCYIPKRSIVYISTGDVREG